MRRALLLVLACGGDATPSIVASGNLVTIEEGEHRTLQLTAPATIDPGAPLEATIDGGTLSLHAGCSTIKGTSGPPHLFVLTLHTAGGDVPLAVEVTPSAEGECRPTLVACEPPAGHSCMENIHATECPTGGNVAIDGGRIGVNYVDGSSGPFPNANLPDRIVTFELVNPDPVNDTDLEAIILTDGPFKFHFGANPQQAPHLACTEISNSNIVGGFELDYRTGSGSDPSTPVVSSGVFELAVNKDITPESYGLQVVSCASAGMSGCKPIPTGDPQWTIREPAPQLDTTMQLRLWATPPGSGSNTSYDIAIGVQWEDLPQQIELDDGSMIASGSITETASSALNSDPVVITAHLGPIEGHCLDITAIGNGSDPDFHAQFIRSVFVTSGSGTGTCLH